MVPAPAVELAGAVARDRTLSVRCRNASDCRLTLDFEITAPSAVVVLVQIASSRDVVLVDGQPAEESIPLEAGQSVRMRIELTRAVHVRYRDDNLFFMMADALWARHMVLAPRSPRLTTARREAWGLAWTPIIGEVEGALRVSAELSEDTTLAIDEQPVDGASAELAPGLLIHLNDRAASDESEHWVRQGGPVLGLGAFFPTSAANETRFGMRLGYEFGIHDWIIVSGAIETDFDSQATLSLLLEGATPNMLFFIMLGVVSISAGVGATLELSPTGARGGVRLSGGVQAAPLGVQLTFDYYPDGDDWTIAVMGRVSI